jgi:hypothetical protein
MAAVLVLSLGCFRNTPARPASFARLMTFVVGSDAAVWFAVVDRWVQVLRRAHPAVVLIAVAPIARDRPKATSARRAQRLGFLFWLRARPSRVPRND